MIVRFWMPGTAVLASAAAAFAPCSASASLIDFLSTPAGIVGGMSYTSFRVEWEITQNPNGTYHYVYDFLDAAQGTLTPEVSHVILELSDNITKSDLFNFVGVGVEVDDVEFGSFSDSPSNPGFPTGESIFGVKLNTVAGNHLDFRTAGGTRVVWVMRSDFEPPSKRAKSF